MQDSLQCDQAKSKREQKIDLPKISLKSQADLPEAALQDAQSHPETLGTQNALPHVRPHPVSFPLPCYDAWRGRTFSMALQEPPAMLGTSLLCCVASRHGCVRDWIKYGSECTCMCSVQQLKEMQTDPPKERKETCPPFFNYIQVQGQRPLSFCTAVSCHTKPREKGNVIKMKVMWQACM